MKTSQLQRFSTTLERLYHPVPLEHFSTQLFAAFTDLLPEVQLTFDQICTRTGTVVDAASFERPLHYSELMAATLARDHPGVRYAQAGGTERVLPLWELTSHRVMRETEWYRELFHPLRLRDQVVITVPAKGKLVGLTVNRTSLLRADEIALLRLLAPHVEQAYAIAERLSGIQAEAGRFPRLDPQALVAAGLTVREAEVLHWIAEGKRDREIAAILQISPRTIEKHVANILQKLRVETRVGAVVEAGRTQSRK